MHRQLDRFVKTEFNIFPSSPTVIFLSHIENPVDAFDAVNFGSFECCSEMECYCEGLAEYLVFSRSPNRLTLMLP